MFYVSTEQLLACTVGQVSGGINFSQIELFVSILKETLSEFGEVNILPFYPNRNTNYHTEYWRKYYFFNEADDKYYKIQPSPLDFLPYRDSELLLLEKQIFQEYRPPYNILRKVILKWRSK